MAINCTSAQKHHMQKRPLVSVYFQYFVGMQKRRNATYNITSLSVFAFSALMLLVGRLEGHPACKKTAWWGAGVVICLKQGADLHIAQLMPLPLTVSCSGKIQIGFTFLVLAYLGSPGKRAIKRVCVCVAYQYFEVSLRPLET